MTGDARNDGLETLPSEHSVEECLRRLLEMLSARGVAVFAVVDHSEEAQKVGLTMPSTKLVIFGNPKAGTPLMLVAPTIAIDLPLKILIREAEGGKTLLSYSTKEFLGLRHGLPEELWEALGAAGAMTRAIAG